MTRRSSLIACTLALLIVSSSLGSSPAPRVLSVPDAGGDALLVVPRACEAGGCPLLVVSHRWGGTPQHGLDRVGHPTYSAFLARIADAGYALLLSADGGLETWGNAAALENAARVWESARGLYAFTDTFTLGVSMGGLPASLLGLTSRLPVRGTVTIGAQLSLADAVSNPRLPALARSAARAYGLEPGADTAALSLGHDPVGGLALLSPSSPARPSPAWRPVPTLAVASRADATVDFAANSYAFVARLAPLEPRSKLLEVSGAHLGADHFSPRVADAVIAFLNGLRSSPAQTASRP